MPSGARFLWLSSAVVVYFGVAALRAAPAATTGKLAAATGVLVLFVGAWLVRRPPRGYDPIDERARVAGRLVALGAAVVAIAELGPPHAGLAVGRLLGVGLAGAASAVALGFVSSPGGIASSPPRARADAAALVALASAGAAALGIARITAPGLDPGGLAQDYAAIGASIASLGATAVAAQRLHAERRFELGVAERASAALWVSALCLAVGGVAALMEAAAPERSLPLAALAASILVSSAVVVRDPVHVARALRVGSAATLLGTPLMSVAVVVAFRAPTHAGLVLFVATALAVLAGVAAPRLAAFLAPERGRRLTVLERALAGAKAPDPREAVIQALARVRDAYGADAAKAALYRFATGDRVVVDRADYPHTEAADVPRALVELLGREPERVISAEALRSVMVQRAEARPLVAWLDERQAYAVALIVDDDVPTGMFLWPSSREKSPLSHEEATALALLAAHLGAATGAQAQLERSQARELDAERARAAASVAVVDLQRALGRYAAEKEREVGALAARARGSAYGPAATMALLEVERCASALQPFALVAAPGIDALAWAAVAHLSSPAQQGVFTCVDAANPDERPLERWASEVDSALARSQDGTLVVLDAHRLPHDSQRYLATRVERGRSFVAVIPGSLASLAAAGALEPSLLRALGERSVALPPLAERSEDLRALALHELSRIGLATRGEPLGLALDAQERLFSHDWPGNDAELRAVLWRAALATDGLVLTRAAVESALGRGDADERPSEQGRRRLESSAVS